VPSFPFFLVLSHHYTYKVERVSACVCIDVTLWVHSLVTCVTFSVSVLCSSVRIHNSGSQNVLRKTQDIRRVCVDNFLSNKIQFLWSYIAGHFCRFLTMVQYAKLMSFWVLSSPAPKYKNAIRRFGILLHCFCSNLLVCI